MVQVLVVRVDIGVVIYEAMTPQCGRSVVQVLVVRAYIEVVIYEVITSQCGKSSNGVKEIELFTLTDFAIL